ncbi:hypothetical protein BASA50_009062 [Batrachochytrium salamandrivorans]|uniref:Uncharacterized protein n=1 Tax=Batrachochytrium salamandrivorans TaxID=1357716 RepID=A0ABQ8F2Q7_9FUNG|nr:hypothetical protein BASA50_009062 [Batrachochytrium salamandrivorans]
MLEIRLQLKFPVLEHQDLCNTPYQQWTDCDNIIIHLVHTTGDVKKVLTISEAVHYSSSDEICPSTVFLVPSGTKRDSGTRLSFEIYSEKLIFGRQSESALFGYVYIPNTVESSTLLSVLSTPTRSHPQERVIGSAVVWISTFTLVPYTPHTKVFAYSLESQLYGQVTAYLCTSITNLPNATYAQLLEALKLYMHGVIDKTSKLPCEHSCLLNKDASGMESLHTHKGVLALVRERLIQEHCNGLEQIQHQQKTIKACELNAPIPNFEMRRLFCIARHDRTAGRHVLPGLREAGGKDRPSFSHIDRTFVSLGVKNLASITQTMIRSVHDNIQEIHSIAKTHTAYSIHNSHVIACINSAIRKIAHSAETLICHISLNLPDIALVNSSKAHLIHQINMTVQTLLGKCYPERMPNLSIAAPDPQTTTPHIYTLPHARYSYCSIHEIGELATCIGDRLVLLLESLEPLQLPRSDQVTENPWSSQIVYHPLTLTMISTIVTLFVTSLRIWTTNSGDLAEANAGSNCPYSQESNKCENVNLGHFVNNIWPFIAHAGFVVPFSIDGIQSNVSSYGISCVWQIMIELQHRLVLKLHPQESSNPSGTHALYKIAMSTFGIDVSVPISNRLWILLMPEIAHTRVRVVPLLSVPFNMRACRIDPIGDACSDSTATSHEVSHKINDHTRKLIGEFANSSHKFMARRWKARLSSKSSLPRSVHDGLKRLQEVASSSRQTAIRGHRSVPRYSLASRNRLDRDYAFAGYSKSRHPVESTAATSTDNELPFTIVSSILRDIGVAVTGNSRAYLFISCTLATPLIQDKTSPLKETVPFICQEIDILRNDAKII